MAQTDPDDNERLVRQLVNDIQRESLPLGDLGLAVSHLVEQIGFQAACEKLRRSAAWVSKRRRLHSLPEPVVRAILEGKIKDADAAHDVTAIHYRSRQIARELLDLPVVRRSDARQARRQLKKQVGKLTTFGALSREQREEVAGRFLSVMEGALMSPANKLAALEDLARDAQCWVSP